MKIVMRVLSILEWISGFICGISFGRVPTRYGTEFSFGIALVWWSAAFIVGALFFSVFEILKNQESILSNLHYVATQNNNVSTGNLHAPKTSSNYFKKGADEEKSV